MFADPSIAPLTISTHHAGSTSGAIEGSANPSIEVVFDGTTHTGTCIA
jgi:hypothetical protein